MMRWSLGWLSLLGALAGNGTLANAANEDEDDASERRSSASLDVLEETLLRLLLEQSDGAELAEASRSLRAVADRLDAELRARRANVLPIGDSELSVFEYLIQRYDIDGDGEVSAEEYDRDETAWSRLDRDEDGVVTAADFEGRGGGRRESSRREASRRMARGSMIELFGTEVDEEGTAVERDALADLFDEFDLDENAALDSEECDDLRRHQGLDEEGDDPRARMMGSRFEQLARLGGDESAIDRASLMSFFDQQDDDEDGRLVSAPETETGRGNAGSFFGRGRRGGGRSDAPTMSGPAEGSMAPDFTLDYVGRDGQATLSSHREVMPVALIFGSYT